MTNQQAVLICAEHELLNDMRLAVASAMGIHPAKIAWSHDGGLYDGGGIRSIPPFRILTEEVESPATESRPWREVHKHDVFVIPFNLSSKGVDMSRAEWTPSEIRSGKSTIACASDGQQ